MNKKIKMRVNGKKVEAEVPTTRLLIDFIRYDVGLTGTKEGCSVGVCGACTVLMDGDMISSCLTLAVMADGHDITTVEGLAKNGELNPVQKSFIQYGGFQCGICTPGQVVAATALLEENPKPNEDQIKDWMMGNLCRCTGYYKIIESIQKAHQFALVRDRRRMFDRQIPWRNDTHRLAHARNHTDFTFDQCLADALAARVVATFSPRYKDGVSAFAKGALRQKSRR